MLSNAQTQLCNFWTVHHCKSFKAAPTRFELKSETVSLFFFLSPLSLLYANVTLEKKMRSSSWHQKASCLVRWLVCIGRKKRVHETNKRTVCVFLGRCFVSTSIPFFLDSSFTWLHKVFPSLFRNLFFNLGLFPLQCKVTCCDQIRKLDWAQR